MGCDIHFIIERQNGDGTWHEVPYYEEPYGTREQATTPWSRKQWERHDAAAARGIVVMPEIFRSRSYNLFGLLADVRNGSGFAGVRTGDGWPAQFPNRGLPADATRLPADVSDDDYDTNTANGIHSFGDHSFTWATLDELKAVDWDHISSGLRGVVAWSEWTRFRDAKESSPREWCGGVSGLRVEILSETDALVRRRANLPAHEHLYVECVWGKTAREATDDWAGQVLPVLERIADGHPLRLLISFDS